MGEESGAPKVTRWREMGSDVDTGVEKRAGAAAGTRPHALAVALGRRVEVIGDLLLPPEPTDSSRAACRDIAQRLEEWQGPGIVILCGRLVAPGCPDDPARRAATASRPRWTRWAPSPPAPTPRWSSCWRPPSGPGAGAGAGAPRGHGARRRRPRVRDGSRHAHRARARRHAAARRQPAPRRDALRRPALAGRHGAPRRPAVSRAASSPRACCTGGCAATSGPRHSRWP